MFPVGGVHIYGGRGGYFPLQPVVISSVRGYVRGQIQDFCVGVYSV